MEGEKIMLCLKCQKGELEEDDEDDCVYCPDCGAQFTVERKLKGRKK
jgi:DNA-directed RNA polymerase subunit RPC12/RpoP